MTGEERDKKTNQQGLHQTNGSSKIKYSYKNQRKRKMASAIVRHQQHKSRHVCCVFGVYMYGLISQAVPLRHRIMTMLRKRSATNKTVPRVQEHPRAAETEGPETQHSPLGLTPCGCSWVWQRWCVSLTQMTALVPDNKTPVLSLN